MRWFAAAALMAFSVFALPAPARCQGQPAGPDPLLCAVPPQAVVAALVDLGPETESMKALASTQTPEQAAVIRASVLLGLQQILTSLGADADIEKDVLPWLTRRAALCLIPIPEKKEPAVLLLIETRGGTPASACVERLVQGGVKSKKLVAAAPVDDTPVWKTAKDGGGFSVTYMDPVVILAWSDTCLPQVLKHMKAINAGAAAAPVTQSLVNAPPGLVRFAVAPYVFAQAAQNPAGKLLAANGMVGAVRFNTTGVVAEVALSVKPDAGPWPALASLKPTFAESVAGIPDTAAAVLSVARPSVWFHGLGVPIVDAVAAGMVGPAPLKAIGKSLAPILSDVFGQEIAIALVPTEEKPSWLATFTTARPNAFAGLVNALVQSGQGVQGIRFTPAPVGDCPGWVVQLDRAGRPPFEVHLAVVEARLLAAGSRKALEAGATPLTRRAGSVSTAEWYTQGMDPLGANPIAKGVVNIRAVPAALTGLLAGQMPVSPKYTARLADAVLAGVRQVALGVRIDGGIVRAVGFVGLDYPKVASLGGVVLPAAVGLAAMASADKAKAGAAAGGPAAAAAGDAQAQACMAQMRQICQAAQRYAKDWGKLPPADGWAEALDPYLKNKAILRCPADGGQHATCYAYNRALAEIPLEQIGNPGKTILFYECASAEASPAGTGQGLPNPPRHGGKHVFGFADGHVELAAEANPAWWGKK